MTKPFKILLLLLITNFGFSQEKESIQEKTIVCYFAMNNSEAEFPGGTQNLTKFVKSNLKSQKKFAGKAIPMEFVILENGEVENIFVKDNKDIIPKKQIKKLLEKMPKWKPKISEDKVVKSNIVIEIKF